MITSHATVHAIDQCTGRLTAVQFDDIEPVVTPQGHRIRPLIDGRPEGNAPGMGICAGGLDVRPGFVARPHYHASTDVIVYVQSCGEEGAITLYGPCLEHEVRQFAGQLLAIPHDAAAQWAHTVVNPSLTTPIRAYEFRLNTTVVEDNPLLPALQPRADDRAAEILVREHGADALRRFQASTAAAHTTSTAS